MLRCWRMSKLAIIGGTGVYDPDILQDIREETVATPYGQVTALVGVYQGKEVVFLPRHGAAHSLPPHKINYRANIWGLKEMGVTRVLATAAVGSLNLEMKPGHFVLLDQFIDFTKNRPFTFFDGEDGKVVHTDFTHPYCAGIRRQVREAAAGIGLAVHEGGCYVCTEGPRYETPAEIRAFQRLGGDVVGMTNVPEVVLARELGLCYGTIAMVTNFAAGISPKPLTHQEVVEVMRSNTSNIRCLVMETLSRLDPEDNCCRAS